MKVSEYAALVRPPELLCLDPTSSVADAANALTERKLGAAPVLEKDKLVGIFTERDVLAKVVAKGKDPNDVKVRDAMTRDPTTIDLDTTLSHAGELMAHGHFRHLPVVDVDKKLVGFLSQRDLASLTLTDALQKAAKRTVYDMAKAPAIAAFAGGLLVYVSIVALAT